MYCLLRSICGFDISFRPKVRCSLIWVSLVEYLLSLLTL